MLNEINDIKYTTIDEKEIALFKSEDDFMRLSVDLMIEVGQYICVAACILPGDRKAWSIYEAILVGHVVRLFKLIDALLDQTCKRRRETTFVFGRLAFECIINLKFLIKNASPELFKSYIQYSLKHEKKLRSEILKNIEERGGEVLDIEQRMLNSINKAFRTSETTPDEVTPSELKNWGGKNLFEKARDVGLADGYLAAIGGPSHNIHGNWQELIEYNIKKTDEGFVPSLGWRRPRPQLSNAISYHAVIVTNEYLSYLKYLAPSEIEVIIQKLEELHDRIVLIEELHEDFLNKYKPELNTAFNTDAD
jgi:hypothetical protein